MPSVNGALAGPIVPFRMGHQFAQARVREYRGTYISSGSFFSNHLLVFEIRVAYFDRSILLPGPVPRLFILLPFSPFPFRFELRFMFVEEANEEAIEACC